MELKIWIPCNTAFTVLFRPYRKPDKWGHCGDAFTIGSCFPVYPEDLRESKPHPKTEAAIRKYWGL